MASVKYSCPFEFTTGDPPVLKKCDFISEDSRVIINHCLEWHSAIVGVCHELGCEGKVSKAPESHWEEVHAGESSCAFCDVPNQNYGTLKHHLRIHHQQQMGYVYPHVPPPSERRSLENTMKLFVSAPTLQFIPLRPNFGVFYDLKMNRPVMGAEMLHSDLLKWHVARPRPISFKHNLLLPETQVSALAVQHVGFHAAHIIPADDWTSDFEDFNATFDTANLTAMKGFLNRGQWSSGIEKNVRKVAMSSLETLALTICHYNPSKPHKDSLSKKVYVPESYSKVIYSDKGTGSWIGQVFNVKNKSKSGGRENFWQNKCSFEELHKLSMSGITLKPVTLTWEEKVKVYRCKEIRCSQSFYDYHAFKSHKDTHEKEFGCSRCDKLFDEKNQLDQHIGFCFLRCRFCDKPCFSTDSLLAHERTHTGEKPYVCKVDGCGTAYASRGALHSHKVAAHGIGQHFCMNPNCDKVFSSPKNLKRHKFSHYTIKRYKCSECDESNHRKSNVQRHQSAKHGGVGTVIESEEWKALAKRLKDEEEEAAAMAE